MRESRGQLTAVSKAGGDPAYLEGMPVAMPFHCHLAEEGDCGLGQAPVCEIAGQRTGGGVEQRPAGWEEEGSWQGIAAMPWKMSVSFELVTRHKCWGHRL